MLWFNPFAPVPMAQPWSKKLERSVAAPPSPNPPPRALQHARTAERLPHLQRRCAVDAVRLPLRRRRLHGVRWRLVRLPMGAARPVPACTAARHGQPAGVGLHRAPARRPLRPLHPHHRRVLYGLRQRVQAAAAAPHRTDVRLPHGGAAARRPSLLRRRARHPVAPAVAAGHRAPAVCGCGAQQHHAARRAYGERRGLERPGLHAPAVLRPRRRGRHRAAAIDV